MNLTSPADVRTLTSGLDIRPSRALGQNFLIDGNVLRILVDAAELRPDDHVLEIGPGLGAVTELLLQAQRVVAIEKDRRLAAHLQTWFKDSPQLTVICDDALNIDMEGLMASGCRKVVSNLPYSSGTRILVELIRSRQAPDCLVVTVQREVADRMVSAPGSRSYGLLSVWLQLDYCVEIIRQVKATCFWPRPEVSSSILRARRLPAPGIAPGARDLFYRLTRHAFSVRRKQMATVMKRWDGWNGSDVPRLLGETGIACEARPEDVSPRQWAALAERLIDNPPASV